MMTFGGVGFFLQLLASLLPNVSRHYMAEIVHYTLLVASCEVYDEIIL